MAFAEARGCDKDVQHLRRCFRITLVHQLTHDFSHGNGKRDGGGVDHVARVNICVQRSIQECFAVCGAVRNNGKRLPCGFLRLFVN